MEQIFGVLQQGLSGVFAITILLGLLIFVHELGHFLVAVWCGVRVEVFSLGFGTRLVEYKRGDTTYCISAFPLGGYVKMFGDDPSREISPEEQKVSFLHKPVGQRIAIVLAGPLMNFFFAIFLFFAIAQIGEKVLVAQLGDIEKSSAAYAAGFRSGDKITHVNGEEVELWEQMSGKIQTSANQPMTFKLLRNEQSMELQATPELHDNPNILSAETKVGLFKGLSPVSRAPLVGISDINSVAYRAGLRSGLIYSINGIPTKTYRDLVRVINQEARKGPLVIEHGNKIDATKLDDPKAERVASTIQGFAADGEVFQALGFNSPETFIANVSSDSPAMLAGLEKGDRIVKIGEQPIDSWAQVLKGIKSFKPNDPPVPIDVVRNGEVVSFSIQPKMTSRMNSKGQEEHRFQIGIRSAQLHMPPETIIKRFDNLFVAADRGFQKTWHFTVMTAMSFVRLFQAEISPKNIGGVITIGQAATETFQIGITQFLQMMAIISINLFLINLLPIPLLDGGHLMFYFIEVLRGAPLSLKKMEMAQQVGLLILVSLMVFAFFNDITRIMNIEW